MQLCLAQNGTTYSYICEDVAVSNIYCVDFVFPQAKTSSLHTDATHAIHVLTPAWSYYLGFTNHY